MDAAGVERAVVGDIAGTVKCASCFEETLRAIEPYRGRLFPLLWVCPSLEGDTETAAIISASHSDRITDIKLHPATAHIRTDSPECEPYLCLCERLNIPFVSHTEADGQSDIRFPAEAAKAHPAVRFVAVHRELRTDHRNAAEAIARITNLYGNTALVRPEDVLRLVRVCGAKKLLYGTDAPVPGTPCHDGPPRPFRSSPGGIRRGYP